MIHIFCFEQFCTFFILAICKFLVFLIAFLKLLNSLRLILNLIQILFLTWIIYYDHCGTINLMKYQIFNFWRCNWVYYGCCYHFCGCIFLQQKLSKRITDFLIWEHFSVHPAAYMHFVYGFHFLVCNQGFLLFYTLALLLLTLLLLCLTNPPPSHSNIAALTRSSTWQHTLPLAPRRRCCHSLQRPVVLQHSRLWH